MVENYNPLRILIVSARFARSHAGWIGHLQSLIPTLLKKGCHLRLLTSWGENEGSALTQQIQTICMPIKFKRGMLWHLLNGVVLSVYTAIFCKDFDLIYLPHCDFPSGLLSIVARCFRKKIVGRIAGSDFNPAGVGAPVKQIFWKLADGIIVLNQDMRHRLSEVTSLKKIHYIPNGVDLNIFTPEVLTIIEQNSIYTKQLSCKFLIIFIGTVVPQKGVVDLLHSFEAFTKTCPNSELLVIGPYDLSGSTLIKTAIKHLHSRDKISLIGEVSDVRPFLKMADAFVLPSYSEGMSNSLLEAMACGLPCIASDIPGINDIVTSEENGLLVQPGSEHEITLALSRLANDANFARKLGAEAQRYVYQNHNIETISEKYAQLFDVVCNSDTRISIQD